MAIDLENNLHFGEQKRTDEASHDLKSCDVLKLEELTKIQIIGIALSGDFDQIHRRNKEVGATIMGFHHFFEWHKVLVETMRDHMKPKHGSKKRTLVDGEMLTWGEYCLKYYGVGHDWVARMIRAEYTLDTAEPEDAEPQTLAVEETEPIKPKEKQSWVKKVKMTNEELEELKQRKFEEGIEAAGARPDEVKAKLRGAEDEYQADLEAACSEAYERGVADAQALEAHADTQQGEEPTAPDLEATDKAKRWYQVGDDSRSLGTGSKSDLRAQGKRQHDEALPADEITHSSAQRKDRTDEEEEKREPVTLHQSDPYFHFHQFRDEPQTMASELAAMLLEFRLDEQQTTMILDLLKKELKAQRKASAA